MPDIQKALENIAGKLSDLGSAGQDLLKDLKDVPKDVKNITKSFSQFKNIFGDFASFAQKLKIPFLENIGTGIRGVESLTGGLDKLGKAGFPMASKGAAALSKSLGVVGVAVIAIGKTVLDFHKMIMQARMEIGKATLQMGEMSNVADKASTAFLIAEKTVRQWGANIDSVTNTLSKMIAAGFNPTEQEMEKMIGGMMMLKTGFQITDSVMMDSIKLMRQEYNVSKRLTMFGVAALTKKYKELNMTTSDYMQTLVGLSRSFLDLGIGIKTIKDEFDRASQMGLGVTRARQYAAEMIGGPRRAGVGQRAYLAERLGIGGGNTLAGAAMLAYGRPGQIPGLQGKSLGEKAIELGLKDLSNITTDEFKKLSTVEKYGMAQQVAMYVKQFGISERTTMESFKQLGLDIRIPQNTLIDIGKSQIKLAEQNVKELGQTRDVITKMHHTIKSLFYGVGAGRAQEKKLTQELEKSGFSQKEIRQLQFFGAPTMKEALKSKTQESKAIPQMKHYGGMIRYHDGLAPDERQAILKVNEGVLNAYNGVPAVGGPEGVKALNEGKTMAPNINVNIDIPVFKEYIEEAILRFFRENPITTLMG